MGRNDALLVEGTDDRHVLYALLKHHAVAETFAITDKKGINNILGTLEVELIASDRDHLGIIIDADDDIALRWQSLQDILHSSGYGTIPDQPDPDGTIILEPGKPDVGIWIMPDNALPGMLEDFIRFLVPPGDSLWPHAVRCTEAIGGPERRFIPRHLQKATVHAWLAWQEDPGSPLGQAITKRYCDADAPHAQRLIAWIKRLFGL